MANVSCSPQTPRVVDAAAGLPALALALTGALTLSCVSLQPDIRSRPEAGPDNYALRADSTLVVDSASGVLGNDTGEEGEGLSAVLVEGASNGTLTLESDGSFTYVPARPGFAYETPDTFVYRARDAAGGLSDETPVVILVSPAPGDMICPHAPSGDVSGDVYRIVSPNGGEVYRVGDTVAVHISVHDHINTNLKLLFDVHAFSPPANASFDPYVDSIVEFVIPEYFEKPYWNEETGQHEIEYVSPVSDSCLMRVTDYDDNFRDYSDCYFSIVE